MRFDDPKFINLVNPYVTCGDAIIVDALREGAKKVFQSQGFFISAFEQSDGDKRIFSGTHDGWGFGKLISFEEKDSMPRRQIFINTGEPLIHPQDNPDRTTITCDYFGEGGGGEGVCAVACVALQPRDSVQEIPDLVFDSYRTLFRAAAMMELIEFLNPDNTVNRDWRLEYVRESNWAKERFAPIPTEIGQPHSFFRPLGGGFRSPQVHRGGWGYRGGNRGGGRSY